jgi:hypothetical protein
VNEAAAAIASQTDDVARRAVRLLHDVPALDDRGRRLVEDDAGLHVRMLVGSVVADDPGIFGDYAVWAAELLRHLGVAPEPLAALLEATDRAIAELLPSVAATVRPHLEAGERALAR